MVYIVVCAVILMIYYHYHY